MATVQLKDLPIAASAADTDITHIQAVGIDKQVTKLVLLQEIQAEVDENTTNSLDSVHTLPLSGGGSIVVGKKINELQDGGVYTIPLANTVDADTYLIIELTSAFSAFTPSVQRSGGDDISYSRGTDISIIFDNGADSIRLVSDGISEWRM